MAKRARDAPKTVNNECRITQFFLPAPAAPVSEVARTSLFESNAERGYKNIMIMPKGTNTMIGPDEIAGAIVVATGYRAFTYPPDLKDVTAKDGKICYYAYDPSDEPLAHAEFSFDFERIPLTKDVLRELLTSEMLCSHPDFAATEHLQQPSPPHGAPAGDGAPADSSVPMEEG